MQTLLFLSLCTLVRSADPVVDEILSLPGWTDPFRSKRYSGFLKGSDPTRHIAYYFIESEGDPLTDNVLLWMNGGPGCSSFIGAWLEQGPLTMNGDTTISENPGRWNINANVLFIESPPGVGFSYIDKGVANLPYTANDTTTAADSLAALADFFATYHQFNKSDLWLSGESYSGVYIPWLARAILQSSQTQLISQLKGVLVGNGALKTNDNYEGNLTKQRMQHAYNHGLFSSTLKKQIDSTCLNFTAPRTSACDALLQQQQDEIGPLNSYDIEVTCLGTPSMQQRALIKSVSKSNISSTTDLTLNLNPCTAADTALTAYMNRPDVQTAMHFTAGSAVIGPWGECQDGTVDYTRIPCDETIEVYPILLQKIAVIIYNGDQDECIPYLQDEAWTEDMGYPIKSPWRPWLLDNQVAGYVVEYNAPIRFTFLTVKNAGHEVPMYQPLRALAMVQRVMAGSSL